jgi:hypothetical protein
MIKCLQIDSIDYLKNKIIFCIYKIIECSLFIIYLYKSICAILQLFGINNMLLTVLLLSIK